MQEVSKEYIEKLRLAIEQHNDEAAQALLKELHPADIAEIYQELSLDEAKHIHLLMDAETAAEVLMELDEEDRRKLLKELPSELIAKRYVDNLETDDAV
ncbi:MAG: magnesium transporter MgtE N-terminal domain-containing protein, partial [Tannerellaceae bacterium]